MTDRCEWSELPHHTCDHCTPGPRPSTHPWTVATPSQGENVALTIVRREHIELPPTGRFLPEETRFWEVTDYIAALCDHTINSEPRTVLAHNRDGSITTTTTRHLTTNPPLINQLWEAAATSKGMDGGNRVFGSSPSASLEALDMVMRIEQQVHHMLRHDHGEANSHDDYPHTIQAVRHLGSLTGRHTDNARTIRSWWAGARVVTGWDLPAWKPNNTCPLCAHRGGLRVKYPTAICVECRETWDEETIGLLVEHIRSENHEDEIDDTPDLTG